MVGQVDHRGTPIVPLPIAGQDWPAIIDTGFDGAVMLPAQLAHHFASRYVGDDQVTLAGGQTRMDKVFEVDFPFDGERRTVKAYFGSGPELIIGTELLAGYRLEINFVARTVVLKKVATA